MTTHTVGHGGATVPTLVPWSPYQRGRITGTPALVRPGRPVTMGPAACQGCGSLVWWSGGLWTERDGRWHRCAP